MSRKPSREEAITAAGRVIGQWVASLSDADYVAIFGNAQQKRAA